MALNPREVERLIDLGESLSPDERRLADEIELRIDSELPRVFRRGRVLRPSLSPLANEAVIREVARRYAATGGGVDSWRVDIEPGIGGSPPGIALMARLPRGCRIGFRPRKSLTSGA